MHLYGTYSETQTQMISTSSPIINITGKETVFWGALSCMIFYWPIKSTDLSAAEMFLSKAKLYSYVINVGFRDGEFITQHGKFDNIITIIK